MNLTPEQQAILDGAKGETMAKVMETLVLYGDAFDADCMVPVAEGFGHTVISFGVSIMKPVYKLYQRLLEDGAVSLQPFTADPRPLDDKIPKSLLQDIIAKFMYSKQELLEKQLDGFGLIDRDAFTCACYLPEVGNIPKRGDVLSWAESSAVVYANSVLGARCNRNSGVIELMGSIMGMVPQFGFLLDEGRRADWVVEIRTSKKPEAQLLGSAIGMRVLEKVPYIKGLDKWIGRELDDECCAYLKDFGAATASNGSVGLYHIANLTPEAVEQGESLIRENTPVYVIDDAELQRVKDGYPCIWKDLNAKPKLCFLGCPHMTMRQLTDWTEALEKGLAAAGNQKVMIPTVFTAAPAVIKAFEKTEYFPRLEKLGVILSSVCPLMYMNNPLVKSMPVITSSNKLRTYTTARFYLDSEILEMLTKGVK